MYLILLKYNWVVFKLFQGYSFTRRILENDITLSFDGVQTLVVLYYHECSDTSNDIISLINSTNWLSIIYIQFYIFN